MNSKTLMDRALALHRSGKLPEAEALYEQAAQADAGNFAARNYLGVTRAQQGRAAEALAALDAALALAPGDYETILNRANVLQMLRRHDEALAGFDLALKARPGRPQVINNRGNALQDLGRLDEALACYDQALALGFAPALNNRGSVKLEQKRFAEALADFDRVLALHPDDAVALNNRGSALQGLRRHDEAVAAYDRSIALSPKVAETFTNRAGALQQLKRHAEALADFERALALDPAQPHAFGGAAMAALNLCDWRRAARFASEMPARVAEVPPWVLLGYSGDEALQLECARHAIARRFKTSPPPLAIAPYAHDRIRLAYISSDFRHHPVAAQVARVIELHDRSRFEVTGLSTGPDDGGPQRRRLRTAFDRFEDVQGRAPRDVARMLREREVDILIDLNGHTEGDSFDILVHRPAPVQASWLGYAGTTAAPFIDYLIADDVVAPRDDAFSERLVRLPHSFFPADNGVAIGAAPTRAQEGLPPDGFVFCCFNNSWKFTAPVFAIWMRLLQAVPGSVLWLKQAGEATANLQDAARVQGVDPARLVFAKGAALEVHLARHALADLFLDTLPYNAHATACDALYAGLPVLTCRGTAFAGRVAASLLTALRLPELIAETARDYETRALALARDPAGLNLLREKLAAHRATAPLFDTAGFTRDLEEALISTL